MTTDTTHVIVGASLAGARAAETLRAGAAGMNVNIWDVNDAIQALVRGGQRVDKNALRDPQTPLQSVRA